jgi:predicted O-methyltransferase YrrM
MTALRWDQPSRLLSVDDDSAAQNPGGRLIEIMQELAQRVPYVTHHLLDRRKGPSGPRWHEIWPGEHYNLLTAITEYLIPRVVWEFGTFTGAGTVAIEEGCCKFPGLTTIFTVDNNPPNENWFHELDFGVYRIVDDFLSPSVLNHNDLPKADLIFIDGPKDNKTEAQLLCELGKITFRNRPIVVMDDIREPALVYVWRNIQRPKMDLTSLGHFTGTGIIDWTGALP